MCKHEVAYQHVDEVIAIFDMEGVSNDPENQRLIEFEKQRVLDDELREMYKEYRMRKAFEKKFKYWPDGLTNILWKNEFLRKLTVGLFGITV